MLLAFPHHAGDGATVGRFGLTLSCALLGLLSAGAAQAGGPGELGDAVDPQAIYGGTDVVTCGWPTTVTMEGSCTGTLVHPQVVIFAAHCGSNYSQITMGETLNVPKRKLATEFCKTFPGGGPGSGNDFAFCKLQQPVLDVPIVPIVMGCETEILSLRLSASRPDNGIMTVRTDGHNEHRLKVCTFTRAVLLPRRPTGGQ